MQIYTHSNYRLYSEGTLARLGLIECYKKEKLTLEEIKERLCGMLLLGEGPQ